MSDFKGHWTIDWVNREEGDGSRAPQEGPWIWIVNSTVQDHLAFIFVSQHNYAEILTVPINPTEPDRLFLPRPANVIAYWLDAKYNSANPPVMAGTIKYGSNGGEDTDIATFTATKTG